MPETDYEHSILSISNALRSRFNLPVYAPYDPVTKLWAKQYRCVITVLVDAMGAEQITRNLREDAFVRKYMFSSFDSVYPPTTTAATTSFLSGRYPDETGWLGWHQYFTEVNDEVILFLGTGQYSRNNYPGCADKALPVRKIYDELNEKGIKADSIWPSFGHNGCHTFKEQCDLALKLVQDPELQYLYVYWDLLDDCMHHNGPYSSKAKDMMQDISDTLGELASQLPADTGLMVIADHGQVDTVPVLIGEDEKLLGMLSRLPSLEARTMSFQVKKTHLREFEAYFRKTYPFYDLYSMKKTCQEHVFGYGTEHPRFRQMLGDYVAFARTPETLFFSANQIMKGHHGGAMREERKIPLILYPGI